MSSIDSGFLLEKFLITQRPSVAAKTATVITPNEWDKIFKDLIPISIWVR